MSAQSISTHAVSTHANLAVSFKLLLGLYAIIPACLLLRLFDNWFWQDYLQHNLPSSPYHFILFQIMFGTPHIIASAIVLVSNTEYITHYKHQVILMTLAIALAYFVGNLFISYRVLYVIVASWTVYHVLKQQHGIARGICRLPDREYNLVLWLSVAAGIFIYVGIFLRQGLSADQTAWLKDIAAVLCLALMVSTVYSQRYVNTSFGRWFLWSNVLLVLSSFYLYAQQYYFLAILVPRFVHDATAYIFYVTHDYNKHHEQPKNFIYRYAARCGVHVFVVLPAISFALAFVLQAYGDNVVNAITQLFFGTEFYRVITVGLLGYLALMHYYTEAFTWKGDSPYRQFIAFKK
jgi:hypothetical protein